MKPMMQTEPERPTASNLWDTLVRVALIGSLAWLCLTVFSPFLKLMVWSIILAVNLYPAHQWVARKLGKRQGLASVILVVRHCVDRRSNMVVDEFLCRFGSALCWRGATKHIAHTRAARIREEFAISRKQNSCRMVKGSNRSPRSG